MSINIVKLMIDSSPLHSLYGIDTVERVNANSSYYRWKIQGFSKTSRDAPMCLISPVVTAIDSKVKWRLKLYPNGKTQEDKDFMVLTVHYHSLVVAKARVDLSFVNIDNEVLKSYKVNREIKLISNSQSGVWIRGTDYFKFGKRNDVEDSNRRILTNDCLTISFDIIFHDPIFKLPISSDTEKEDLKDERLKGFDDFGKLLENGRFSDVKFVVGDKKIHAHKAILASRSPVFNAMFQHEMQETKQNVVEIIDIDYGVLMELFRFIYTGTVANIELVVCDLLVAAEKYCIDQLKTLCERTLLKYLTVENALECFITADNCNAANLKKKTLEFIVKHGSRVIEREEFAVLRADLMCEITRAMARKL